MGQDIADYGGVFKITEGFVSKFGKDRVRNTPLCESAIVGAGLGLSIKGMKSMVEMQFADFVTEGFNQIVNNLAKAHWRWGQPADVVVRMPTGARHRRRSISFSKQRSLVLSHTGFESCLPVEPLRRERSSLRGHRRSQSIHVLRAQVSLSLGERHDP